jgi:hypothetical protein
MKKQKEKTTIEDILLFLKENMVMKSEFESALADIKNDFATKFDAMDRRIGHLENVTVTKEYLDRKLADLGAEFGGRLNKSVKKDKSFKQKLITVLNAGRFPSKTQVRELEALI